MDFRSRAVRSLVELHERELSAFLATFRRFTASGQPLPPAHGDPDYASPETLLCHVLRAGAGYLTWIGECVRRPVTDVYVGKETARVAGRADEYLAEVLAAWRRHLPALTDAEIAPAAYLSRWGELFTVEGMLEHAVVHPMRHRIQLERVLEA